MKKVVHRSFQRGIQDHGWLKAAHSFSFSNYYDPLKMGFGALRVLNDDVIAPGMGFGMHRHENMEIVTIPLKGALAHRDSLGSEGVITTYEIQAMSAGNGIHHSEFNASTDEEVNLLQIWVLPKVLNIQPRYDQMKFAPEKMLDNFLTVVSPVYSEETLGINQDAFFSIGQFNHSDAIGYRIKHTGNGVYIFVINGEIETADETLSARDAIGLSGTEEIVIHVLERAHILVIEVPVERN